MCSMTMPSDVRPMALAYRWELQTVNEVSGRMRLKCCFWREALLSKSMVDDEKTMQVALIKSPIRSLNHSGGEAFPVNVVPIDERHLAYWENKVQPIIDNKYVIASKSSAGKVVRADVGWNWRRLVLLARLHNTLGRWGVHGKAHAMCMVIEFENDVQVPIGMLTTVPLFSSNISGVKKHRGFGWFLSDAPKELYAKIGQPRANGVAMALIDCGIQAALDRGGGGEFLLRASPDVGDKLIDFYMKRMGMMKLKKEDGPISRIWRRCHADEYFCFDDIKAQAFCEGLAPFRVQKVQEVLE